MNNKRIFKYQVNGKDQYIDPYEAIRELWAGLDGEFNDILKNSQASDSRTACNSQRRLVPVVREVFSIPAIDRETGEGMNDKEAIAVLKQFIDFMEVKKKNRDSEQTFALNTELEFSA